MPKPIQNKGKGAGKKSKKNRTVIQGDPVEDEVDDEVDDEVQFNVRLALDDEDVESEASSTRTVRRSAREVSLSCKSGQVCYCKIQG